MTDATNSPAEAFSLPGQKLYQRTAAQLLDEIRRSGAVPGDRLPSERQLGERYGVSRVTLRAALKELEGRGVIASSANRGWFLAEPAKASVPVGGVQGLADYAAANGLDSRAIVVATAVRPSTIDEAETLKIGPGAALFTMSRLRFLGDQVVVLEHNRVPHAMCPALAHTDFEKETLFATLRASDPPQIPSVANYEVEARNPTEEERGFLEITDGTPVLVATQLAFNQQGRPLELTVAVYRADRYRFRGSITN
ncbi:GntR family transcriptional regulator [Pseudarthrobacter sp. P1]|uniref:GntR family transcriptional regulator n=1 Tax=Pseudarthrobacter sp. P1 TaxID=3418418 RepID=UPI003CECFCCE